MRVKALTWKLDATVISYFMRKFHHEEDIQPTPFAEPAKKENY